jgi:hypothetical protein
MGAYGVRTAIRWVGGLGRYSEAESVYTSHACINHKLRSSDLGVQLNIRPVSPSVLLYDSFPSFRTFHVQTPLYPM